MADEIPVGSKKRYRTHCIADNAMLRTFLENIYDGLNILVNNAGIAGPTAAVRDITVCEKSGPGLFPTF